MAEGPEGRERRLAHRVPVQQSVRLLNGWRRKEAALLGLSLTGCRLVADAELIARGRVRLFLPAARPFRLPLRGEVAWSQPLEGDDAGLCQAGIHFTRMPARPRRRLERALAGWLREPAHESAADS
jgi:hypothetical protein